MRNERSDIIPFLLFPGYSFPGYTSPCRTSRKYRKTSSMQKDYSHIACSLMGHVVCRSAFCSLFNVTDSALVTASARIKSMGGGLPVIKRKEKHERKRKDSDKERVIIKELEYYARRYGYPSPCGKVLGGDVDEEEKELFILSSHMDKKSVWEAIMAEKAKICSLLHISWKFGGRKRGMFELRNAEQISVTHVACTCDLSLKTSGPYSNTIKKRRRLRKRNTVRLLNKRMIIAIKYIFRLILLRLSAFRTSAWNRSRHSSRPISRSTCLE